MWRQTGIELLQFRSGDLCTLEQEDAVYGGGVGFHRSEALARSLLCFALLLPACDMCGSYSSGSISLR